MQTLKTIDRQIRYLEKVLAQGGRWQKGFSKSGSLKTVEHGALLPMNFKPLSPEAKSEVEAEITRLRKLAGHPVYFAHRLIHTGDKKYWGNTGPARRTADQNGNLIYVNRQNETTV